MPAMSETPDYAIWSDDSVYQLGRVQ